MSQAAVVATFREAGVRGWLHARRVDDPAPAPDDEVAVDADGAVPIASVYKLALAAVWGQLVDDGVLDPTARIRLTPQRRTPGATGVAALVDEVELSSRDLVRSMVTVSDNDAADHLLDLVGGPRVVTDLLHGWGLTATHVRRSTGEAQRRIQQDTGTRDFHAFMTALSDAHREVRTREYDSALASTSTARDLTALLAALWRREIAPGTGGDVVLSALRGQVWPHRLRSGFPHDDVVVAGKTGSLGTLRHDVGVVEFPDEVGVAVAVLTRSARAATHLPAVDRAIGEAAAHAVRRLRRRAVGG